MSARWWKSTEARFIHTVYAEHFHGERYAAEPACVMCDVWCMLYVVGNEVLSTVQQQL